MTTPTIRSLDESVTKLKGGTRVTAAMFVAQLRDLDEAHQKTALTTAAREAPDSMAGVYRDWLQEQAGKHLAPTTEGE